jgi:hypothetical protein
MFREPTGGKFTESANPLQAALASACVTDGAARAEQELG